MAESGLQNEKYIYLDFAWISRAGCWAEIWMLVGLTAVVLVARPLFMLRWLCGRVSWRVAAFARSNDKEAARRLTARNLSRLQACGKLWPERGEDDRDSGLLSAI